MPRTKRPVRKQEQFSENNEARTKLDKLGKISKTETASQSFLIRARYFEFNYCFDSINS